MDPLPAKTIRMLVVGTGEMARSHVEHFQTIPGVAVVAGVDVDPDRVADFADAYGIENRFTDLRKAIGWGGFDAASNVTPDWVHYQTTMALLDARIPVLCEKPLAQNYAHALEMAEKADECGLVNMVNLTYRNVAALQTARNLIGDGALGAIRHFEASYLQSWLTQPAWGDWRTDDTWLWRLSSEHGSLGVLGDVGVHILDFATFAMGTDVASVSCALKTFDKAPGGRIGKYRLDANDSAVMHVALEDGALGVIHCSRFATGHINDLRLRIYGEDAGLEVAFERAKGIVRICRNGSKTTGEWEAIEPDPTPTNYMRFINAIRLSEPVLPDFRRGAALQRVLDTAMISAENGSTLTRIGG